jgi:tRNA (uracil-5-)-methyltransferase
VVDPPRNGLHPNVITALRTCKGLDTLVYVSCNAKGNMTDNVL